MIPKRNISNLSRILFNSATNKGGSTASSAAAAAGSNSAKKAEKPKSKTPPTPTPESSEPFRNDQYNCPEYYQHDRFSFFELILQMADKRLPQKSKFETYK